MKPNAIPPFLFPTTVAFVDDSASFLKNLSLRLDPQLAFRLFDSPFAALVALNAGTATPPAVDAFFSPYRHRGETSEARHVIDLNLDLIHREVHNEQRFEQVSVVVVDYDMPEIDGLEFCRQIRNPATRKILLTGKADEQVAVRAFNEGIIDRFIRKQDSEVMPVLRRAIGELQRAYFADLEQMLSDALAVGSHLFLRDPEFARRFWEIRGELGIVEHYLCCMPEGLLMLDKCGAAHLLLVQTETMLQSQYEIAHDQEAPQALLEALRGGKSLPYFWRTGGNYSPDHDDDWQACLHPAVEFKGRDWYLYAIVKDPPAFKLDYVLAYADYLDQMDDEQRKGPRRPA